MAVVDAVAAHMGICAVTAGTWESIAATLNGITAASATPLIPAFINVVGRSKIEPVLSFVWISCKISPACVPTFSVFVNIWTKPPIDEATQFWMSVPVK
jgi:hypothetical protein